MATAAAAAAAAMAPPGCPGSCPNFAVVCSFLERYGPLLDLPELPFPELERVLQAPPPDVGNGEGMSRFHSKPRGCLMLVSPRSRP
nr:remodeling and spacing factor 1-like [Microcebus murinus]